MALVRRDGLPGRRAGAFGEFGGVLGGAGVVGFLGGQGSPGGTRLAYGGPEGREGLAVRAECLADGAQAGAVGRQAQLVREGVECR